MRLFRHDKLVRGRRPRYVSRLNLEPLESRIVPYGLSGGAWPHPNLITISFEPDGTWLGGPVSNLFSTFNARFGSAGLWQSYLLVAAQQWAQQTNLNFAVGNDNGAGIGAGPYQQGTTAIGDIRIGGYNFGTSDLAAAYFPSPINNYSAAGDILFNTAQPFNLGMTYDLLTVAMHEFGHALGLVHSSVYQAVMFPGYVGLKNALTADDVLGIRAIYGGARTGDIYEPNDSFSSASAIPISASSLVGMVPKADITTTSDVDYYAVVAPGGSNGSFTVNVQSSGLSLLAPTVTVFNSAQVQLGSAVGVGQSGATLSVTVTGVSPGQLLYVKVAPTDTSANGTGAYGASFNFGAGGAPVIPLPNTLTLNGNPISAGGGSPESTGFDTFDPNEGQAQPAAPRTVISLVNLTPPYQGQIPSPNVATFLVPEQTIAQRTSTNPMIAPARLMESGNSEGDSDLAWNTLAPIDSALADWLASSSAQPADLALTASGMGEKTTWKNSSSACFESEVSKASLSDRDSDQRDTEQQCPDKLDSSAALIGTIVMFGGYWSRKREDRERRRLFT